jgi:hypothetical protein
MKPQDIIYSYLKNHIASVQEAGKNATDVVKALQILENKKKALEQQKKKRRGEVDEALTKLDARLELIEKEILDGLLQIENLNSQKKQTEGETDRERKSFFAKLLKWIKKLLLLQAVLKLSKMNSKCLKPFADLKFPKKSVLHAVTVTFLKTANMTKQKTNRLLLKQESQTLKLCLKTLLFLTKAKS